MKRLPLPAVLAAAVLLSLPTFASPPELDTDEKKMLYTLGFLMSSNLVPYDLESTQLPFLQAGLADGAQRKEPAVAMESFGPQVQEFLKVRAKAVAAKQEEIGAAYREKAAAEEGARAMASGLIFQQLEPGDGPSPAPSDAVTVQYKGTLVDGSVFDDSRNSPGGGPAVFKLDAVVPCFREGIQAMQVGGRAKIVCPAALAYGARGYPPKILGGATLTFELELLAIGAGQAATPAPTP